MRMPIAFLSGFAACALLVASLGAGPDATYQRACECVEGEYAAHLFLLSDKTPAGAARRQACLDRALYWVKQMEQFKP